MNNQQNENPFFSNNGRIIIQPFRTDTNKNKNDSFTISFYNIGGLYTYSIQAKINNRIFCKYPHPQDCLYSTIQECKEEAEKNLKDWTDQNKLKKGFLRLVPAITRQLDLFDALH